MTRFIADLHIHSKYSRATSKAMDIDHIAEWARIKGIDVVGTGDFTHPAWFKELKSKLRQAACGLYIYKGVYFLLTAEVSNIYTKYARGRRIHNLIFAPDFESVEQINHALSRRGNVLSDGRPIFGFDAKDLVKICLDISDNAMIVPAHIWTPWFSLFGSMSGFDSVEECFEEESGNIYALETGLSADPAMCWRISALDRFSLISNSDAHSPGKLGREANIFDTEISYNGIINALKAKDKEKFSFTVEFFPEEGKYHYDGHRSCGVRFSPQQTDACKGVCPECNKPLTVGVMNRVNALADRPPGFVSEDRAPFKRLVPLAEIIALIKQKGIASKTVAAEYQRAIGIFGNEFHILLDADKASLHRHLSEGMAKAVLDIREGNVRVEPGYDGVYGTIGLLDAESHIGSSAANSKELF
jgi:uncharacterized protein (TIGR00375 family)